MQGAGWIVEDSEKKALEVAEILKTQGKIDNYDKVEKYISRYKRTHEPIYKYKIHCFTN
jgi:hypothetical protein